MSEDTCLNNEVEVPEEILNEASELGWLPQEKWKGDPDKWVDAETFVERGKQVLPILKKNNDRLRADLLKRDTEIGTLRNNLSAMGATIQKLETAYNEGLQRALENQRRELRKQLAEARRDGDVDTELDIQEQLDEVEEKKKKAKEEVATPVVPKSDSDQSLSPEFVQWKEENPWFGVDAKKTKAILRAAEDLREEGEKTVGAEFFELAAERAFGEKEDDTGKNKVESPRASGGGGGGSVKGKTFNNLPKEAQDACMQDQELFVGPGKMFKELKEWQTYYTKLYHGEPV